ncbi:MAG: hypothetical protein JRJ15_03980, partial [Deltaproteobacteria bacterium]|nr:hypothetical protein [Deltaproteobacteria bacterium]
MGDETGQQHLLARIGHLEENSRFIQEALEMALSLGDFQENINENHDPLSIFQEAERRINRLISFDICAFYLVNEDNFDIALSLCKPAESQLFIEDEIDFMTDKGLFAWALRERKGVFVKSKDQSREFLFHVIATYSRIRGMFVGLLPDIKQRIPDASRSLLSIIFLNTANAIESLEKHHFIRKQNRLLEAKVEERTKELLAYERRLQRAQKMEAIGTLAGGVAHDLNNILAGLVSYPELLLMDIPEDSPLRRPIQTIKASGDKAATIVQDLLTLARRGVGARDVVNLNHVISEYLKSPEFEKLQLYHPHVQVEPNLATDLLNISGSPVHLSKTVMNLISNAAEAMPNKGKIVISTVNQYIDFPINGYDHVSEGDYVRLTVSDSGTGISPEDMERIFEPFYTKKEMGRSGTGLGMAVVWGTVKDHNGYIDIESVEGKGTTFKIYFPMTKEKPVKDKSRLTIEDYMGSDESVLVVDDVKEQRDIATEMLTKLGYSVTAVSNGKEAVEY